MGLIGNFRKIVETISETETVEVEVTYPATLPEGHRDYDKRGTTGTVTTPRVIVTEEILEDVYIAIDYVTANKFVELNNKPLLDFGYRVYNSKAERDADPDNYIYREHFVGDGKDFSSSDDVRKKSYEYILQMPGFENMTSDE